MKAYHYGNRWQKPYHLQRGQIPARIITWKFRPTDDMQLKRQTY